MKKILSVLVCVCVIVSAMVCATFTTSAADTSATITFNDSSKAEWSSQQQLWQENGITVTNNKASSTNNIDTSKKYSNPARFYKGSELIVEYPGMTKIVFDANSTSYATELKNSCKTGTVSISSDKVTVEFDAPVNSYTISSMSAQVRMDALTVYAAAAEPTCEHTNTSLVPNGDETHNVVCADCNEPINSSVACTDNDENGECDECGGNVAVVPPTGGEEGGETTSTAPVAGKAYRFGMIQENVSTTDIYYLNGALDGYYMDTTTDIAAGCDIYVEETTGGYYLYAMVDGAKLYINMVVSGTYVNGKYEATASTVYTYDEDSQTMVSDVNGAAYWIGTRNDKTYTTVGPVKTSYNGFYCKFYDAPATEGGEEGGDEGGEVTPPTGGEEGGEVTPPTGGEEGGEVTPPTGDGEGDDTTGDDTTTGALVVAGKVEAGTAYKFGMVQANVSTTDVYYLAGGMDGYYMATTTDAEAAIDIYVEETTGGYYLYTMVDGVKTYINMVVSGTHVNGAYEAAASTVYTYDADAKTMVATVNDELYWFATRNDKTYTTLGPAKVSYAGFYGQFYAEPIDDDTTGDDTTGDDTTGDNDNTTDDSTTAPSTGANVGAFAVMAIAAAAVVITASKKRA